MSDKLELKDIACYLPYKLKMYAPYGFRPNGKESTGVPRIVYLTGDLYADIENMTFQGEVFKPILRPMTDLVKPLPDGTIPIAEMWSRNLLGYNSDKKPIPSEFMCEWTLSDLMENISFDNYSRLFEYLYAHHFDINNLIGRGLAVDINTIQD